MTVNFSLMILYSSRLIYTGDTIENADEIAEKTENNVAGFMKGQVNAVQEDLGKNNAATHTLQVFFFLFDPAFRTNYCPISTL